MSRSSLPPMPEEVRLEVIKRGIDLHGRSGMYQVHHALLSKGNVRGLPPEEQAKIHHRCNLLVIPAEWHASHAKVPNRAEAYRLLRKYYTKHEIHAWFNSISWRDGPPFRLPED